MYPHWEVVGFGAIDFAGNPQDWQGKDFASHELGVLRELGGLACTVSACTLQCFSYCHSARDTFT